ncbi:substrate-binding domain-containing protein, partial [Arthrobacter sp. CP30]
QYGPSNVLMGIQEAARAAGYFLTVMTLDGYSEPSVDEALRGLLNHGVEGVIAITPHVSALEVVEHARANIPLVTVGGGSSEQNDISLNQESGSQQVVEHLVALGHQRIAHLAGPLDWVDARRRINGWRSALERHGLMPGELYDGDWSAQSGYRVGRTINLEEGPSAVFVANDQMALGFMKAIRERGFEIPRDISVIGFDDVPGAQFWEPSLTTVRQEFREVGGSCIRLLISMAAGQPIVNESSSPRLIVRSSTGSYRST